MKVAPEIVERTFKFALRVIRLCKVLQSKAGVSRTIGGQLLRSGTSVGANVQEAQAAQSRADFVSKMTIALKEARETCYWLRLVGGSEIMTASSLQPIVEEATAIANVLGAIVRSTKRNQPTKPSVNV